MSFIVTEKAKRPVSNENRCFYCHQKIGDLHLDNCELIHKKVKVQITLDIEVETPSFWTAKELEFHRNEGTWCACNVVGDIERYQESKGSICLCGEVKYKYIADASEAYLGE